MAVLQMKCLVSAGAVASSPSEAAQVALHSAPPIALASEIFESPRCIQDMNTRLSRTCAATQTVHRSADQHQSILKNEAFVA